MAYEENKFVLCCLTGTVVFFCFFIEYYLLLFPSFNFVFVFLCFCVFVFLCFCVFAFFRCCCCWSVCCFRFVFFFFFVFRFSFCVFVFCFCVLFLCFCFCIYRVGFCSAPPFFFVFLDGSMHLWLGLVFEFVWVGVLLFLFSLNLFCLSRRRLAFWLVGLCGWCCCCRGCGCFDLRFSCNHFVCVLLFFNAIFCFIHSLLSLVIFFFFAFSHFNRSHSMALQAGGPSGLYDDGLDRVNDDLDDDNDGWGVDSDMYTTKLNAGQLTQEQIDMAIQLEREIMSEGNAGQTGEYEYSEEDPYYPGGAGSDTGGGGYVQPAALVNSTEEALQLLKHRKQQQQRQQQQQRPQRQQQPPQDGAGEIGASRRPRQAQQQAYGGAPTQPAAIQAQQRQVKKFGTAEDEIRAYHVLCKQYRGVQVRTCSKLSFVVSVFVFVRVRRIRHPRWLFCVPSKLCVSAWCYSKRCCCCLGKVGISWRADSGAKEIFFAKPYEWID